MRALSAGIRGQQGLPRIEVRTAASDMDMLAGVRPIPMAACGPGDSAPDHSDDEHFLFPDHFRGIAVLTTVLTELNDLAPGA